MNEFLIPLAIGIFLNFSSFVSLIFNKKENGEEDDKNEKHDEDDEGSNFGQGNSNTETQPNLSVAQIIVTCATPMVEEAATKFPEVEEPTTSADENVENDLPEADQKPLESKASTKVSEKEKQVELKEQCDDDGFGSNQFEANFEANFDANFEDAFASQTIEQINEASSSDVKDSPSDQMPKQVVGGRASIPEELDSQQLARLQNLKESNA